MSETVDTTQTSTFQGSEQERFLREYDPGAFERPSLAVDTVLLTVSDGALRTLLVCRSEHPFKGLWALPGSFVALEESLEQTAGRVLATKAGLSGLFLEQLYTFGDPGRDPRTRVVSVAYYALVDRSRFETVTTDRERRAVARLEVPWEGETGGAVAALADDGRPLELAFDHADILGMAVKRLRGKLDYTPVGFQLLGERFTLRELQEVHETIRGTPVNKDSFRRRMLQSGLLEATGDRERGVEHRPAELYRFRQRSAV